MTTTYVLDVGTSLTMVLSEKTGTDPAIYYLHGLGLVAQSDGTNREYFHTDGLGSVRQMTNALGSVLLAQTFDPYGNLYTQAVKSTWTTGTSYGWAGEQRDGNGLVFLRARYYAPSMGRFLNMDPSREEQNPFVYGGANPVVYVDPSGQAYCDALTNREECEAEDFPDSYADQAGTSDNPITKSVVSVLAKFLASECWQQILQYISQRPAQTDYFWLERVMNFHRQKAMV